MAGSVKKRIGLLRESGDHDLADWLELRERAKASGGVMWRWDKENPKPGCKEVPIPTANAANPRPGILKNKINFFKENPELLKKNNDIPAYQLEIIEKIRDNKKKLKARAKSISESGEQAETELKTLYQVLKKLDNEEKKIIFQYDFQAFDEYMFEDLQDRVPTASFHNEMIGLYNTTPRACVVCPRGHAKSTTARKYILHQILYKLTKYAILIGASEDMAAQNLRWVRDSISDNPKIVDLYGVLKNPDKWADTEFQTKDGIKVVAKGAGQKIRGVNEKGRPDFIYIDDLEEDEQVSSRDRREKLRRWFTQALLPAKSRTGRIIITGTILHLDSLLKNISENNVKDHLPWQVLWYQAISKDENGVETALWEEHKPLSELRALRETDPETFAQEYQNSPNSGSMAVFNREEYSYIRDIDIRVDNVDKRVYVLDQPVNLVLTTDLALSEREGADYTVFMMSGMDSKSNLYVIEYMRFRSSDPYEQIDLMFDMMRRWGCEVMTMEQVAFQKTFKRILEYEMEKRGVFFYIHEVSRQLVRKIFRIKSLKAPIRAQKIMWQESDYDLEDELAQVSATSLGKHDDIIDCLADAWEVQVELSEDRPQDGPGINTIEWAIEEGLLPTVSETGEIHYLNNR